MARRGAKYRIEGEDATGAAFKSVMGRAQSTANKISGMYKAAFAGISVAAIASAGRQAIEFGDELEKARQRAKLTAAEISSLAHAAKQSDVDLGALTTSIQKMQIFLSKAKTGTKENVATLQALGLEVRDIINLKADDQFELIAEQVSKLASEEDRARAVTEVFGKAGGELLPMFQNGARGIREAREEAEKLGLVFTDEQLKRLSEADDAIKRMNGSWNAMWTILVSKLAPAITQVADGISGMGGGGSLDERIAKLESELEVARNGRVGFDPGFIPGVIPGAGMKVTRSPEEIEAELRRLQSFKEFGEPGGPARGLGGRGRGTGTPPGFVSPVDEKAIEARERARREAAAARQEEFREALRQNRELNEEIEKGIEEHRDEVQEQLEKSFDAMEERLLDLEIPETMSDHMKTAASIFDDAWDDMLTSAESDWEDFTKFLVMEFVKQGIPKLFNGMFGGGGGGKSLGELIFGGGLFGGGRGGGAGGAMGIVQGEWDWMKRIGGIFGGGGGGLFGGIFGGGRARGGDVEPGMFYRINEDTANSEWFAPRVPGRVIPAGDMGGTNVVINYNVNAPNSTVESIALIPRLLKQHSASMKSELIEELRRRVIKI